MSLAPLFEENPDVKCRLALSVASTRRPIHLSGNQSRRHFERYHRDRRPPASKIVRLLAKPALLAAISIAALGILLLLEPISRAETPERWTAYSKTAQSITGDVTFTRARITFGDGRWLPLAPAGLIPGHVAPGTLARGSKLTAQRYRVTSPADPVLLNGNRLCGGRTPVPVTIIVVSRVPSFSPATPALIVMEVFSGGGGLRFCGSYSFDVQPGY
jgi:hypothetical protein